MIRSGWSQSFLLYFRMSEDFITSHTDQNTIIDVKFDKEFESKLRIHPKHVLKIVIVDAELPESIKLKNLKFFN